MKEWIKTEEKLPEKYKLVEVKTEIFPDTIGQALLIDTEYGSTLFLYGGIIHMAINMVKEWREI